MCRPKLLLFALGFLAVCVAARSLVWQSEARGFRRSAPATPGAATPTSLDELLAMCPATDSVPIPGAERGHFALFGYGRYPLWLVGWGIRGAATPIAGATAYPGTRGRWAVPNDGVEIAGYRWPMKALWVIDGKFQGVITVHGATKDGRTPLWTQPGAETPTEQATFDAAKAELTQGGGWLQYPSYVIFPATGCYNLVAKWDGGSWRAQVPFFAPETSS
jgi:hypothetical protein